MSALWCGSHASNLLVARFVVYPRFSGDAILVLYEPDRGFMAADAPSAARSRRGDLAGSYEDLPAMRNAAYRAVSEGLKVEYLCV